MQNPMILPGQHQLPPLPYPYDALEPIISSETLRIHHDRHHLAYVQGLNRAEMELVRARATGNYDLVDHWEREIAFNGSGHILHSIYWTIMAPPETGGEPGPMTLYYLNNSFGSFEAFKEQFLNASEKVSASGWGILAWQPAWQRLVILTAEEHQDLTQWGSIPILVADVWEHAYYLDYQNSRREYLESWWQLINWKKVERRLLLAIQGKLPLELNNYYLIPTN